MWKGWSKLKLTAIILKAPSVIKLVQFRFANIYARSMKNTPLIFALFLTIMLFSCKSDDSVTCVTCSAPQTLDFVLCKESDGNASVNGENTGTPYDLYLQDLQEDGASCGG